MNIRDMLVCFLKGVLLAMWQGFIDSLRGAWVIFLIDKQINEQMKKSTNVDPKRKESTSGHSPAKYSKHQKKSQVMKQTLQCCLFNGGACWAVIVIVEYGLLASLDSFVTTIFEQSTIILYLWSWIHYGLLSFFKAFWVVPMFFISKVINCLLFQDIADCAYRYRQGRRKQLSSISKLIADMLFSILVQFSFLFQSFLVSLMPLSPIGEILAFVHMCLLYALYAFEYKWFNMGWELHRRLEYIEYNWPYFIGFGLPLAIVTRLPNSYIGSTCVFSILFPLFIISGNEAEPVTGSCDFPLKLFSPVIALSNIIFNRTIGPGRVR